MRKTTGNPQPNTWLGHRTQSWSAMNASRTGRETDAAVAAKWRSANPVQRSAQQPVRPIPTFEYEF